MTRTVPTKGNVEWYKKYLEAFIAKILHNPPPDQRESIYQQARELQSSINAITQLERLNRFEDIPEKQTLEDSTAHMEFNDAWFKSATENIVSSFGQFGTESVSNLQEAVCYSFTMAELFGSNQAFYRGEERYGHPLISRAERHMTIEDGMSPGLTSREIQELRRFQKEVWYSKVLRSEIKGKSFLLPRCNDPIWLPIMQHYDDQFGTRLLDISSSIFTGLYFACISWDGEIDESCDGILYLFLRGGAGLLARGFYHDRKSEDFDEEFDDLAPPNLKNSFKKWVHPEYFRIYKSSADSPREIAQDGWFLVRGTVDQVPEFGQGFKFRIPAQAKRRIAKQLWVSGYTPERIVHGERGRTSRKVLAEILGLHQNA